MGKVHYKFEYNKNIDDPVTIKFGTKSADLLNDKKEGYLIEGDVEKVFLTAAGKLHIYAETSGTAGQTWSLSVSFGTKKLKEYPIERSIKASGKFTLTEDFEVES